MVTPKRLFAVSASSGSSKRRRISTAVVVARRTRKKRVPRGFAKKVHTVLKQDLEKKIAYLRTAGGAVTAAAPLNFDTLSDIATGTSNITRIGDEITPVSVRARYLFRNTGAFVTWMRIILCKVTTKAATTAFSLTTSPWFISADTNVGTAYTPLITAHNPQALYAKLDNEQVTVIYDKKIKLARTAETNGSASKLVMINKKLKGKICYEGAAGGASVQSQRYYMIFIAYSPEGAATVTMTGDTTMLYVDT